MTAAGVRTMIVDPEPVYRAGISLLLGTDPAFQVIAAVGTNAEALLVARERPLDLAIVDLVRPRSGAVALTRQLKQVAPTCRVLGLAEIAEPLRAAALVRAGADGLALRSQGGEAILEAAHCVMCARRYLPPTLDAGDVARLAASEDLDPRDRLTHREREIYERIIAGATNDDLAKELSISRRTVETHRQNIMRKLDVCSLMQLLLLSLRLAA